MKRFVLALKILVLALMMVLISVGCAYTSETVSVSKDKVKVGEQVELSVEIEKSDGGCSDQTTIKKIPGNQYAWEVTPSDGATVKGGVFVASKPGDYTVTAIMGPTTPTHRTIVVQGTAAETIATETTVFTYILFSDGVVSDPINSSEADFFAKLTIEQGLVDSNGGYLLGGEQTVDGCTGTLSGVYDPDTRQFTGKYWDQVSIPTIHKPDEIYIMNGTFSEVIGHTGKVTLKLEGTQIHKKYTYGEDGTDVWSETINNSREVTFTVIGLD